jgi:hypothetical protein
MNQHHLAIVTRTSIGVPSRREVLRGLLAAGVGALRLKEAAAARKKRKRKPRPKFNAFGCLNVGARCRGKDALCCSGICQGKKSKKGEKDRSECVGHDAATCLPGQQLAVCGGAADVACTTSAGESGQCTTTTGNAPYCVEFGTCFPCTRDLDCQAVCGPQAACTPCVAACGAEGGMACFGPSSTSCTE